MTDCGWIGIAIVVTGVVFIVCGSIWVNKICGLIDASTGVVYRKELLK